MKTDSSSLQTGSVVPLPEKGIPWWEQPITDKSPLDGWFPVYFKTAEEVIQAWEESPQIEFRLGILHGLGFSPLATDPKIVRFLLRIAQGQNRSGENFECFYDRPETIQRLVARKAFSVLSLKCFAGETEWHWIFRQPQVVTELLDFCLDEYGQCRIKNFWPGPDFDSSAHRHKQKSFRIFLERFIKLAWCHYRGEEWYQEIKRLATLSYLHGGNTKERAESLRSAKAELAEIESFLLGIRPRLIDLLVVLQQIEVLVSPQWEFDRAVWAKLQKLARAECYLPSDRANRGSSYYRVPVNLDEACLASEVARILLVRRAQLRATVKLNKLREADQARVERERRKAQLETLAAEEEKLHQKKSQILSGQV